jgi:hypothetical protein
MPRYASGKDIQAELSKASPEELGQWLMHYLPKTEKIIMGMPERDHDTGDLSILWLLTAELTKRYVQYNKIAESAMNLIVEVVKTEMAASVSDTPEHERS